MGTAHFLFQNAGDITQNEINPVNANFGSNHLQMIQCQQHQVAVLPSAAGVIAGNFQCTHECLMVVQAADRIYVAENFFRCVEIGDDLDLKAGTSIVFGWREAETGLEAGIVWSLGGEVALQ